MRHGMQYQEQASYSIRMHRVGADDIYRRVNRLNWTWRSPLLRLRQPGEGCVLVLCHTTCW